MNELRHIPSVDSLLKLDEFKTLQREYGAGLVLETLRDTLDDYRLRQASITGDFPLIKIVQQMEDSLRKKTRNQLIPVINATGVILHTNLGRAVLSEHALEALQNVGSTYSTLEFNLEIGNRGSRSALAHDLLTKLTGAEDALVVNNNAAAVLLVLTTLAKKKQVVISRGQLVEIGGGFRIPEVMKVSGAKLVEVGTTNRVRIEDYEEALSQGAAFVMRAHSSNFKIIGFTEEPAIGELIATAHRHEAILIDDLGSGALIDTTAFGLAKEPMVQDSIKAGADIVCFSGDKLLGGPQAGIIVGRHELIEKIKKNPLARAVRADKLCLSALEATLLHYLKGEALEKIPVWKMMSASEADIKSRAVQWQLKLGLGDVIAEFSTIGGGSLPGERIPTFVLAVRVNHLEKTMEALRRNHPPIIARIKDDQLLFDPRTVLESEEQVFTDGLTRILQRSHS
jgi:L-seryl-tRNA(Ser) seleniumtransferase